VTAYVVETGRRARRTLPRVRAWIESIQPVRFLAAAIAVQWLSTLALALAVRHNGWLYYQGGDQIWLYVSGWLLSHGTLPYPLVGPEWPALLAPITAFGGPTLVPALPAIVLLDVLILGPVALLALYGIARQIGGRLFAYWITVLWLTVPFIGIKFTDHLYHQRYTELTLPQSFGLSVMSDFPSMVAVLVCVYFALRVIERPETVDALAAGLAAGTAIAIKPSNSVFLVGVVLGLAYRRRLAGAALILAGLAPAILTLALWKYRGYGYLPLFHSAAATTRLALGTQGVPLGFNPLHQYVHFDWNHLNEQLLKIREHFWSARVIEWMVVAGLIGLARRSLTALLVVGGWFAAFVVTKGTYAPASIDDASIFRIMMPSYPAFILMIGALVYLWPHGRRARPASPAPTTRTAGNRRRRLMLLGAAALVFALYPLALVATATPLRGPTPRAYVALGLVRSVDPSLRLSARTHGNRVRLSWQQPHPHGTAVFFRVWRSGAPDGGAACAPVPHGVDDCQLAMEDLGAFGGTFVDKPGLGRWTYRLGLAANWLNSPDFGDVYSVGPPLVVRTR
jgi:hypothetical protein